jgi:hypothetical protein
MQRSNIDDNPGAFIIDLYMVENSNSTIDDFILDENEIFVEKIINSIWEKANTNEKITQFQDKYLEINSTITDINNHLELYNYQLTIDKNQIQKKDKILEKIKKLDPSLIDVFIDIQIVNKNNTNKIIDILKNIKTKT